MTQEQIKLFGIFWEYYIVCGVGAVILHFTLRSRGIVGFEILRHFNERWSETTIGKIFESVLFAVAGALVGTIITGPGNYQQAITAGLGWTSLLSALPRRGGR